MARIFSFSASILLLAGSAMATPSDDSTKIEQQQAFQEIMDSVVAEMMKPGPKREGWDKGGVDLFKLVESAPGGAKRNYLLTVDKDGDRNITVVRAGELETYVPGSWRAVLHAGESQQPAPSDDLTIASVDGPFYFAGWDSRRKVNDAFCSTGNIGGHLYEGPAGKEGEIPADMVPVLFNAMVQRLKDKTLCWRYDPEGETFRTTYFLEDGRSLPALNAFEERLTIIPAASVEELLNGRKAGE